MPVPGWLEGRGGQPEGYSHRQMVDAMRFLVDNGIKWRRCRWISPRGTGFTHSSAAGGTRAWSKSSTSDCVGRSARRPAGIRSRLRGSSTPSRSRPPRPCLLPRAALTAGRRSTVASGTSWSTRRVCC
ncbi:hypothetical protein RJT17_37075 [Streptomyces sp. P5-A9]